METDGRARLFTIRGTDRGNAVAVLAGVVFAVLLMPAPALSPRAYAAPAHMAPAPSAAAEKFYVVGAPVDGQREFLFAIAAQTLGDGKRYREIFDLNRGRPQPDGRVMNDPTAVEPGWILLLPDDARGPGVRTGPLPSVAPPSDLPSAGTPATTAGAQPEADTGGTSPTLLATVAGLLLAALAVPLLLRCSRRVPAPAGPSPEAAAPVPGTSAPSTVDTPATSATVALPLPRGPSSSDPAPGPPVTTRPAAAPVASLPPSAASRPPATADPDTPPPTPPRLTSVGPADPPPDPPHEPTAPPTVESRATPPTAVPPTGAPSTADAPSTPVVSETDRQPPTTAPAGPPAARDPQPSAAAAQRQPTVALPVAPQPARLRDPEPQPPVPQPAARPRPTPPTARPEPAPTQPAPVTPPAAPQPVSPPPVAAPRPVTPLTPTTAPKRVSAPLASARPEPLPAPRPAMDDQPASTARLIPVESPLPAAEPSGDGDLGATEPATEMPVPVVTGLRRAIALPTGDLQRVAGIGSLAATAPGWFPPLVTDLDSGSTPMTVRLIGARPARWGSAYGWLEEGWLPPPSTVPVVLGEHDGRRLWVDLAAAPDVLTLGGDEQACQRLGVRLLDQFAPTVDVVVIDDALGEEPQPQRCRHLGSVGELTGLGASAVRVVFCPGASAGILWRERRSLAASAHRTIPVVVGKAPPARWSVHAMAEGPAS
ncbi:hypothetical protein [Micromonospora chokoriensis]